MVKKDSYVSISELDAQESLSIEKIKLIRTKDSVYSATKAALPPRPKDSYIELISWVEANFSDCLGKSKRIRFVHNKIIIDGQFLQFCTEEKIKVESIYDDSIVSWRSDYDNERFFMQGIFHIQGKGVEFLHFALFQKGNQHEDEISFGIIVSDQNYDAYITLRNQYDDWIFNRDRDNLQIRVVDGEDISYEKDSKWEDLFLPEELKTNIRQTVEGFLKSRDIYESQQIPWKRGILLHGTPGCGKSSLIKTIMSNYDFKPVTVLPGANDDSMREAFAYAQDQNPALLYFEDLDSLLQSINTSLFLNLMDGISTKNGILIVATANNLNKFEPNIKDRPSRFDRKFEIPLPNQRMSTKYIAKWFADTLSTKEIDSLSSQTYSMKFSYAYIKELYISSVYIAISNDRKKPTLPDINIAMKQILADKFNKNGKTVGIDKYLGNS